MIIIVRILGVIKTRRADFQNMINDYVMRETLSNNRESREK